MNEKVENNVEEAKNNRIGSNPTTLAPASMSDGVLQIRNILLGDVIARWESRITRLDQAVREFIKTSEGRLRAMEEKIDTMDREVREELETNLMEIEQENDDFRTMLKGIKNEFEERLRAVEEMKMDKSSIADVFIQWGQQVKGE